MAIITTYTDDTVTTGTEKLLTVDTDGSTKLTAVSTLGAYILSDNSVGTAKIVNAAITNEKLATAVGEIGGAWIAYTPAIGGITAGNGTLTARYQKIGKTVKGYVRFVLGTTSAVGGSLIVPAPVTAAAHYGVNGSRIGNSYFEDPGVVGIGGSVVFVASTANMTFYVSGSGGPYVVDTLSVSGVAPFTWATGDFFQAQFEYETA